MIREGTPPSLPEPSENLGSTRAIELAWVVTGHGSSVLAALLGLSVLTRFLPPAAYGEFILAMSASALIGLVVFGPVSAAAARLLPGAIEKRQGRLFFTAVREIFVQRVTALTLVIAIITMLLITGGWTAAGMLVASTFVFSILNAGTLILENVLNAGRHRRDVAVHKGMQQCLNYCLAAALVWSWQSSAQTAMVGFALGAALTLMSEVLVVGRRFGLAHAEQEPEGSNPPWRDAMRAYSKPYERWGVFQWLQATSDRWSLAVLAGSSEVGVYGVAYQLGYTPLGLLAVMTAQVVEPVIYTRAGDGGDAERLHHAERLRRHSMAVFAGLSAVVVGAAFLFHASVYRLLLDEAYWAGSSLVPWLALAAGLFGLGQLQSITWLVRLRPERMLVPRVAASMAGVAFVIVGAGIGGAIGVTVAHVAFSTVFFIWILSLRES